MIDQTTVNFFVKLSLACLVLSLAIVKHVDCRAVQNQQFGDGAAAAGNGARQSYQFQQAAYQQPATGSSANYQYYGEQQQPQQHLTPQQGVQYDSVPESGSGGNKPNRRSILNSLMAPFYAMRDQGMSMLSASLQSCNPNALSMWCRFWSMFINRR